MINPAAKNRRNYWANPLVTDDADDWLERAENCPGSWWPHWARVAGRARRPDAGRAAANRQRRASAARARARLYVRESAG